MIIIVGWLKLHAMKLQELKLCGVRIGGGSRKKYLEGLAAPHHLGGNNG